MTFFRSDPGKSARRIDQRDHWHAKFFAQPHQSQRFAVAFRMGAAKISHHIFLGVASLLVSDDDAPLAIERGETTRHCSIIGKTPVAMQFNPIRKTSFHVIQSERTLGMARYLDTLPGREIAINAAARFAKLCLQVFYCGIEIDIVLVGMILQILQAPFQFKDRSFKIQRLPVHER